MAGTGTPPETPAPGAPITLAFTLTSADVRREDLRRGFQKAGWWALASIPFVTVLLGGLSWSEFGDPLTGLRRGTGLWLTSLILAPLVMVGTVGGGAVWQSHRNRRARAWTFGDVEMRFGPEGIEVESPAGRDEFRWWMFARVRESPDAFLLYVDTINRVVVPKRALAGDEEEARLRDMLDAHVVDRA